MALSVTSGITTAVSGTNSAAVVANAIPINLFGIASGVNSSGKSLFGVGAFSGADGGISLNVNVSGGSITTSISGNIVLVTSGGTIQVSGVVAIQSGEVHVMSGIIGVASGTINIISGVVSVMSGLVQILGSGSVLFTMLSGNVGVSGAPVISGAWVQPVVPMMFDFSGLAYYPLSSDTSGQPNSRVSIWNNTLEANVSIPADAAAGNAGLRTVSQNLAFNGANHDRIRNIVGSSGGSLGVLAIQAVGYSYALVSGAALVNVKSGAAFLHSININNYHASGGQVEIRDSVSGIAGLVLGTIGGQLSGTELAPASLLYDALMTSGIVLSSSGVNWNLTVLWRTATS